MSSDELGIDNGYVDTSRQWHDTRPHTRDAIRSAMALDGCAAGHDELVRVIRQGESPAWELRGDLVLEDGTRQSVDHRLPGDLPLGYHQFHREGSSCPTLLIVTPGQCVLPPERSWGWGVQLYAARSGSSWGIGDLGDLARLGRWSAGLKANLLLINPLYAVSPTVPQQDSPYYPTTRRFFNPLYLHVEDVPGAQALGTTLEPLAAAGRALLADRRIDRNAVFRLKQQALEQIWSQRTPNAEFDQYCRERDAELRPFATFCALAEKFGSSWRQWPAEYRDPAGAAVGEFAAAGADRVAYHQWLQWLLERQLAEAGRMVPLVQDIPVGFDPCGADAWLWQNLLAMSCSVGAPPDAFNSLGQDWAVPPFVPQKLRAAGYGPFIQTVRAVMRHAGGLRIDHVMGLFRLFWIPHGLSPAEGAYVRYRADEMLAILALESQRTGTFVVGEDLGTIEDGMREALSAHHVLSCRVLWFEDRPPAEYSHLALASATTHDLPTVAGLWNGEDLAAQLNIIGPKAREQTEPLHRRLCWLTGACGETKIEDVIARAYARLAEAPSRVLLATLDDALAVSERPNMPGTIDQWPNWRLALPQGLDALESSDLADRIARTLAR